MSQRRLSTALSPGDLKKSLSIIRTILEGCNALVMGASLENITDDQVDEYIQKAKDIANVAKTLVMQTQLILQQTKSSTEKSSPDMRARFQRAGSVSALLAQTNVLSGKAGELQAKVAMLIRNTTSVIIGRNVYNAAAITAEYSDLKKLIATFVREIQAHLQTNEKVKEEGDALEADVKQITVRNINCIKSLYQASKNSDKNVFIQELTKAEEMLGKLSSWAHANGFSEEGSEINDKAQELALTSKEKFLSSTKEADKLMGAAVVEVINAIKSLLQRAQTEKTHQTEEQPEKENATVDEKEARRAKLRMLSVREVYDSETLYYTHLKTLNMMFIDKMREHSLMKSIVGTLFNNLLSIMHVTKHILTQLRERIGIGQTGEKTKIKVGDVFIQFAPVLKIYQNYINNYDVASELLLKMRQNDPKLDSSIKSFCADTKQQDITFYLILPIQRLPRYQMLISTILQRTPEDHIDYDDLKNALEQIKGVNDFVNEKKREVDAKRRIEEINKKIVVRGKPEVSMPNLLGRDPERKYVREGAVYGGKKGKKIYYYYMFSDCLIQTSPDKKQKAKGRLYQYVTTFYFDKLSLRNEQGLTFNLVSSKADKRGTFRETSHSLTFLSTTEKSTWSKDIVSCINVCRLVADMDGTDSAFAQLNKSPGLAGRSASSVFSQYTN
eukprot:TRINITY_DN11718_c0_g1_i2.p1 TRINITY_DN11718_c0_g1~~TRINITY_DN11718_c0_g1_i2.p1  ORF type:complete len:670 (-),score=116.91 TRINITY_DN11718_c0_g1_i2:118-2127(-)